MTKPCLQSYISRALCFMKLKKWQQMREDCSCSLNLDQTSVQARFLLGISQIALKCFGEAVENLKGGKKNKKMPNFHNFFFI